MGDLVVAGEGRVDGGDAAEHVLQHREDDEVADEHAHPRAQQRIGPATMAAGPYVPPLLALRGYELQDDLPEPEREDTGDVRAVGEERAVAGIGLLLLRDPAGREERGVGVAGEQIAAAGAAVGEQSGAGGAVPFDRRAVVRVRAGEHPARALLDPPERRDVLVVPQQDPGLTGAGLGGQVGLPSEQPVAVVGDPAGQVRSAAGLHRAAQDRQREPVDLEKQDPGRVGGDRLRSPSRHPPGDAERVGVVVVDARDGADRRAHHRGEDRDCERIGEAVDLQLLGDDVGGHQQDRRVEGEHEEEADDDGEREPQSGDDRWEHRVQHSDDRRHENRADDPVDVGTRHDSGSQQEGERRDQPGDDQAAGMQAGTLRVPLGLRHRTRLSRARRESGKPACHRPAVGCASRRAAASQRAGISAR